MQNVSIYLDYKVIKVPSEELYQIKVVPTGSFDKVPCDKAQVYHNHTCDIHNMCETKHRNCFFLIQD